MVSQFLNRVTVNYPFFGAVDFWAQFVFLGVFLVVFLLMLFRTPKMVEDEDEDALEEEEEGLLASTGRRFGATWQDITGRVGGGSKRTTGGGGEVGARGSRDGVDD